MNFPKETKQLEKIASYHTPYNQALSLLKKTILLSNPKILKEFSSFVISQEKMYLKRGQKESSLELLKIEIETFLEDLGEKVTENPRSRGVLAQQNVHRAYVTSTY